MMKINPNFILKQIEEEYVLIPLGQDAMNIKGILKTNVIGFEIYSYLKNGKNVEDIPALIAKEYDADINEIKKDVDEFVRKLIEYGVYS